MRLTCVYKASTPLFSRITPHTLTKRTQQISRIMHIFSILLTAACFTGAYAGACTQWYPGTNITNSFNGPFTMTVYDSVTGVTSPLNLVTAVTQPGRTWQVLSVSAHIYNPRSSQSLDSLSSVARQWPAGRFHNIYSGLLYHRGSLSRYLCHACGQRGDLEPPG